MTTRILTGSKDEIAAQLAKLEGDVRQAIVYIEDPADRSQQPDDQNEDFFAEMDKYVVHVGHVDDSREAIYSRQAGE